MAEGLELELAERDDLLSDDCGELLWCELLGELFDELPDDPLDGDLLSEDRPEDNRLRESELRDDWLTLSFDEWIAELESLLLDESSDELDGERDDSLTLENDLLDPKKTDEKLIRRPRDTRYE